MIEVEDELVADIPNRANRISGRPINNAFSCHYAVDMTLVLVGLARENRKKTTTIQRYNRLPPCNIDERRRHIHIFNHSIGLTSRFYLPWPPHDHS